jgi:hypothetical protein
LSYPLTLASKPGRTQVEVHTIRSGTSWRRLPTHRVQVAIKRGDLRMVINAEWRPRHGGVVGAVGTSLWRHFPLLAAVIDVAMICHVPPLRDHTCRL